MKGNSLFLLVVLLTACHPDRNKLVDLQKIRFQSTDASEIYFRNLRRSYYEIEEDQESAIELYTLSDYGAYSGSSLVPTIAYNWRNDFVAIMLNRSADLIRENNLVLIFESADSQEKMILNEADIKTQTIIAVKVYNGILKNNEIFLVQNRQKRPLFDNKEERELFRITIFDFLRFVEMR